MARFPKIEMVCPLPAERQRCLAGFCGHCGKSVQRLDGMDDAQRAEWLAQASGPVCVSYHLPRPMITGLAVAALLATAPAMADQPYASLARTNAPAVSAVDDGEDRGLELIMVGGIADPDAVEWIDETGLPDLPQRQVEGTLEERAGAPSRPAGPVSGEVTGA